MKIVKITLEDGTEIKRENEHFFNDTILGYVDDYDIETYAEDNLDMVNEDEVRYPKADLEDHKVQDMIDYLSHRGYEVLECRTITEAMSIEEVKQQIRMRI